MFKEMSKLVENKITQYPCGFRKGYNTQHALLHLINKLNKSSGKKGKPSILLMDHSKVFDCIPHDLLIAKLSANGFHKCSLKLIYIWLKDKKQRVKIRIRVHERNPYWCATRFCFGTLIIQYIYQWCFAVDNALSVADISVQKIIKHFSLILTPFKFGFQRMGCYYTKPMSSGLLPNVNVFWSITQSQCLLVYCPMSMSSGLLPNANVFWSIAQCQCLLVYYPMSMSSGLLPNVNVFWFNINTNKWGEHYETLEQYFVANDIKDAKKLTATFITLIGKVTSSLLRSLVSPENHPVWKWKI